MAERPRRPVVAYFQPHSPLDHQLLMRAKANEVRAVKNEVYGSGRSIDEEGKIVTWSDRDPVAIARQIGLAKKYRIDGFIVNQYVGTRQGEAQKELVKPLDVIAQVSKEHDFKFAIMCALKGPPILLPYPRSRDLQEKGRNFDYTEATLSLIVDHAAQYWDQPNYLKVRDRPFVGIYGLTPQVIKEFRYGNISDIGHKLQYMSQVKYGKEPFFVAVIQSPMLAHEFLEQGFGATVTYSGPATIFYDSIMQGNLSPLINWESLPVYHKYEEQLATQILFWESLLLRYGFRFYPSASLGLNATSRCEPGVDPTNEALGYPYRPKIIDTTPEKFFKMLLAVASYYAHLPWQKDDFPFMTVWNDVGDNLSVLPFQTEHGIELGYLQALKRFQEMFDLEDIARAMNQEDLRK